MKLWIARDKDGTLWIFDKKPCKYGDIWRVENSYYSLSRISNFLFPEIRWEDLEPTLFESK